MPKIFNNEGFLKIEPWEDHIDVRYSIEPEVIFPSWIIYISFDHNVTRISKLPSLPPKLETLICFNKELEELPELPSSLKYLDVESNKLVKLPELPKSLISLKCSSNKLTEIPNLSHCENLKELCISHNKLQIIPKFTKSVETLIIYCNRLRNLPRLYEGIKKLKFDGNYRLFHYEKFINGLELYEKESNHDLTIKNTSIVVLIEYQHKYIKKQMYNFLSSNVWKMLPKDIKKIIFGYLDCCSNNI